MLPGEVWRHVEYYFDNDTNRWMPKFVLVLGITVGGDVVVRTFTSREHLRERDACSHDATRPGFFLGVVNPALGLGRETWLDLRGTDDIDLDFWNSLVQAGTLIRVCVLPQPTMCPLLLCSIGAPDTLRIQVDALYASRAYFNC